MPNRPPREYGFGSGPDSTSWFIAIIVALTLLAVAYLVFSANSAASMHDNTDPPGGYSGLLPYTDALTGCQYLGTARGGITPRADADGKQICSKELTK